jgi:hypothetical protein
LPTLAAAAAGRQWDGEFLVCVLSAISAAKAQPAIAEAVLEFSSPGVAEDFMDWVFNK